MEKKCCQKCLRALRDGDGERVVVGCCSVMSKPRLPKPHPKCCIRFASVIEIALASDAGFAPVAAMTADDNCDIA